MRIAIVGGGNMGEAMLKGLFKKKLSTKQEITVVELLSPRRELLRRRYGIPVTDDSRSAINDVGVVILAVKPKDLTGVMELVSPLLKNQLVISIVAGYSLEAIRRKLKYENVVRAMPNTPAQIGKGMTAWTETASLSKEHHAMAQEVLSALGEEHYFKDEEYIDMATAVSGSGPAYVYLFIEALTDAGVHIGLPRNVAEKLVMETIIGSAEAMQKMSKHPAEMKNIVTSPGGTTTDALLQLESGGLRSMMINAVTAAYQKAKTIGIK
jgi:pyrroline-5-carboxylate reductase